MAGVQPVGDVALVREPRQLEQTHANPRPLQRGRDGAGVQAARGVVVRDDDDLGDRGSRDLLRVVVAPARRAAGRRRRRDAERPQPVDVLLALDPHDALLLREFTQAIDHPARALEIPGPAAAGAVGPARTEVLRLETDDLVEQGAALIVVVVRAGDDAATGQLLARGRVAVPEQVGRMNAEGGEDLLGAAAREAVEEDLVGGVRDAEGALAVIVRRTERGPGAAWLRVMRGVDVLQAREQLVDGDHGRCSSSSTPGGTTARRIRRRVPASIPEFQ